MTTDYEKQLQEENEKLREKLAEALNILDEKKRILDEKVKKYGDNIATKNWENVEATWKVFESNTLKVLENLNQPAKNSKSK